MEPPMIDHDAVHADRSDLGPPLVRFFLRDPDGVDREVVVWDPPDTPWEGGTWRGWLFIEGHPQFDPPHRICGQGPWEPVALAFEQVGDLVSYTRLTLVS
jgi:hypothetical protein